MAAKAAAGARAISQGELGRHFDAMVGLVERVGDGAVGVSITYLDETDSRKANIEPNKRFRGEINGGAVRLAEATPDDWLIIGEGIETVLSGMQMTGHPGRTAGAAMYEDAKLRTATGLSNLWDGEPIRRVCAGDDAEPTVISHRRLALHLMAQPEIAGAFCSDRTIASQGLLSRALLTWPPTAMGDRKYQGPAPSSLKALARYSKSLIALLEEASSEQTKVWLTQKAKGIWVTYYDNFERRPKADLAEVADFVNKMPEQAIRIAAILRLIGGNETRNINSWEMEIGIDLADFHTGEVVRLRALSP